jgi:cyanophycinase
MAVLGEWIFTAERGGIASEEALQNPYDDRMTLAGHFLKIPQLKNVITDSHYGSLAGEI